MDNESEDERHKCPICCRTLYPFCYPIANSCGHVFCKLCLEELIPVDDKCPVCRDPLQPDLFVELSMASDWSRIIEFIPRTPFVNLFKERHRI